jgi:hypothetical protein
MTANLMERCPKDIKSIARKHGAFRVRVFRS